MDDAFLCDILEIDANATKREIKTAYREKAMKLHPDRGGNITAFIELKKAYDLAMHPDRGTPEEKAARLAKITAQIQKWCDGQEQGTKVFGDMICKKSGINLKLTGTFLAGKLSFDGNMSILGDVSSPKIKTHISNIIGENILIEGDVSDGAYIKGKMITVNNVIGIYKFKTDPTKPGIRQNISLHTRLVAKDVIYLNECRGPVTLEAENIQVGNVKNGAEIIADHITINGDIITNDCKIHARKTLKITTVNMGGLEDECQVVIGKYTGSLGVLKTNGITNNTGVSLAGGGININEQDITSAKRSGWGIFLRKLALSFIRS